MGKGKGEVREGKVGAVDREVREEGKGEERDGRAALPLIKSMIFGRADCGQVDLNVWCFFSGMLKVIPLCDCYRGRAGPNIYIYI